MKNALLIEDSKMYHLLVCAALAAEFNVTCTSSADEALSELAKNTFDLILIDVGLPGKDGLSLCEEIRREPKFQSTPILFVTGQTGPQALVAGFAAGADDYIQKPFHPDELKARIAARLKRASATGQESPDFLQRGDMRFLIGRQKALHMVNGQEVEMDLTPNEFKILFHLAKNEGRTFTRAEILREIWGEKLHVVERTVDKHVCSLRRKMGDVSHLVISVPGEGYRFAA